MRLRTFGFGGVLLCAKCLSGHPRFAIPGATPRTRRTLDFPQVTSCSSLIAEPMAAATRVQALYVELRQLLGGNVTSGEALAFAASIVKFYLVRRRKSRL